MSDKATFDPTQNAQNAAAALDTQLHQIEKPGDPASNAAHEALLALQADSVPTSLQAQVHADLLKIDPQADQLLKQNFPDLQLTDSANGPVMKVQETNPSQDAGTEALNGVARDIAGQIFSTGKVTKDEANVLAAYGSTSAQDVATDAVNKDLGLLGVTDEKVVANDKGVGILNKMLAAEGNTEYYTGSHGEFDLENQNGKTVQKIGKYSEQSANDGKELINIGGVFVPTPGGGTITVDESAQ